MFKDQQAHDLYHNTVAALPTSIADVTKIATDNDMVIRIVGGIMTYDYRMDRWDLYVEDGMVYKIDIG
tara:strand:- start:6521 stop:6724 length:204 start_codon:yes stop_codon:yes gene_type:complete